MLNLHIVSNERAISQGRNYYMGKSIYSSDADVHCRDVKSRSCM